MKPYLWLGVFLLFLTSSAFSQVLDYRIHHRGMLRQTVYNTGEIGKGFARNNPTDPSVTPSFEWPKATDNWTGVEYPINLGTGTGYNGFYNSIGGGIWMAADTSILEGNVSRVIQQCGALTFSSGISLATLGLFSFPVSIDRQENYPVNSDGSLNTSYDPNKPEETIVAQWDTRMGITITRTSYAWSWPGYDDFIIYEYELENTGRRGALDPIRMETLSDMAIAFVHGLTPSLFSMQQRFNQWSENDARGVATNPVYARFDVKRYLSYNVTLDGYPESNLNQSYFDTWSSNRSIDTNGMLTANGGGLAAPGAVGYMPLYYDYDHLSTQSQTRFITTLSTNPANADNMWDVNLKMKQPHSIGLQNGNLDYTGSPIDNVYKFLDGATKRMVDPFGVADSVNLAPYWIGRGKTTNGFLKQPVSHIYMFGPYMMLPGDKMHFAFAEVAGYGAGVASDSVYKDYGGGGGSLVLEPTANYFHNVPSWYKTINQTYMLPASGANPVPVGSNYLQSHPLPWYVDTPVVSIRDVADRAIQMYTGRTLVKYDLSQYEPSPVSPDGYPVAPYPGVYNSVPIPCPAPAITTFNIVPTGGSAATVEIGWGPQVESLTRSVANWSRLNAPLKYYLLLRTPGPNMLGPWEILDTVLRQDPRYLSGEYKRSFVDGKYHFYDDTAINGTGYFYSVVSVDSLGGKSGMTNIKYHMVEGGSAVNVDGNNIPDEFALAQNYPNPFNPTTTINYQLPTKSKVQLQIFNLLGQCVATLVNAEQPAGYYQIPFNANTVASGVYFYRLSAGSFVKTNKMLLLR